MPVPVYNRPYTPIESDTVIITTRSYEDYRVPFFQAVRAAGSSGAGVQTFATAAALRSGGSLIAAGTIVYISCHHRTGDGGQGFFECLGAVFLQREDGGVYILSGTNVFRRIFSGPVNVKWWGAGSNIAISSQDVIDNPYWLGTYVVGTTSWATVGFQECFYFAYAGASTAGHIVWNAASTYAVFVPQFIYMINKTILLVASGVDITFETRNKTLVWWTGDNVGPCFDFDSISYGCLRNWSIIDQVGVPTLVLMRGDGLYGGLLTQQLSIYDLVLVGSGIGYSHVGWSIYEASQGDTINFFNPLITSFDVAGLSLVGNNVLNVNIWGGNFQACPKNAIYSAGATAMCYSTSFQNQGPGYYQYPQQHQIARGGADFFVLSGVGSEIVSMRDIRSESQCVMLSYANNAAMNNIAQGGTLPPYNTSGGPLHALEGYCVSAGTRGRVYMLVDDGGPDWFIGDAAGSTTTAVKPGAGWTVNQWAGYVYWQRFTNGLTATAGIVSNTSDTLTFSAPLGLTTAGRYGKIAGVSSTSPISWDTSNGYSIQLGQPGTSVGFSTTAGSADVTLGSGSGTIQVGHYLVIPDAYSITQATVTQVGAYIGKVLAINSNIATLDKPATISLANVGGYWGPGIVDNQLNWMEVDYDNIAGIRSGTYLSLTQGRARNCGTLQDFFAINTAARRTSVGNTFASLNYIDYPTLRVPASFTLAAPYSGTVDMTIPTQRGNTFYMTINGDSTLNFPTISQTVNQDFDLYILNSGSGHTVTWGSNISALTATLSLGATTGKWFVARFQWNPNTSTWFLLETMGPY